MGQRRPGPLDERRDAASLIALHPFVAGLATNAGSLAQDNEGLVLLQVPGDELHTFIHGVSLIPWHAAACRSLLPMSPVYVSPMSPVRTQFPLDSVLRGQSPHVGSVWWRRAQRSTEAGRFCRSGCVTKNVDRA